MVGPGNSLFIIESTYDGKDNEYHGYLVIGKHRYFHFGGSYDWCWLYDPDFKEIGPLGYDLPKHIKFIDYTVWNPSDKSIVNTDKQEEIKESSTIQLNTSER